MGPYVYASLYCPYYTSTDMSEGIQAKLPLVLPIVRLRQIACRVLDVISRGIQFRVNSPVVHLVQLAQALPVPITDLIMELFDVLDTMNEFIGHTVRTKS